MNNNIILSRTKNGSQKNLLNMNKSNKTINNTIHKDKNIIISEDTNNKSNNEQSFDSIVHNINNDNKKESELNNENENSNDNINKKLFGISSTSTFDKYSQRIEFTK